MPTNLQPFHDLSPEAVLDAVEALGYECDGRVFALNSYENRVYQIGLYDAPTLVAKFYRPERWSDEQIFEEHQFCQELLQADIPVVAPQQRDGVSLFHVGAHRFCLFPQRGGHAPELDNLDTLYSLGSLLGRLHCVGKGSGYQHRDALTVDTFGHDAVAAVVNGVIPADYQKQYLAVTKELLARIAPLFDTEINLQRVHGDFHVGNILWRDEVATLVDFDDSRMAPAVQDIWMCLSGDRQEQTQQLNEILEGYSQFADFDHRELKLIEALRTLRLMHHCAWLAKRWEDPAFPPAFPWFNTPAYWQQHIADLQQQLFSLDAPSLKLFG